MWTKLLRAIGFQVLYEAGLYAIDWVSTKIKEKKNAKSEENNDTDRN